jgi:hypothetical protein
VKDYAFKIHILAGDLERGVLAPINDGGSGDGSLDDRLWLRLRLRL